MPRLSLLITEVTWVELFQIAPNIKDALKSRIALNCSSLRATWVLLWYLKFVGDSQKPEHDECRSLSIKFARGRRSSLCTVVNFSPNPRDKYPARRVGTGDIGLFIGDDGGTALFARVVMLNVVVTVAVPGMTVAELNADVVWTGKPATAKEIGVVDVKPFAVGVTVMVIVA
jgi:hypothetical protein